MQVSGKNHVYVLNAPLRIINEKQWKMKTNLLNLYLRPLMFWDFPNFSFREHQTSTAHISFEAQFQDQEQFL